MREPRTFRCVLPHVILLPSASSGMLPARPASGIWSDIERWAIGLSNEPLHGLLSPSPYPLLQCVKLAQAVSSGVAGLELDEKFKGGLIRTFFKARCHLGPMVLEDIGASTPRFVSKPTIRFGSNNNAARASRLTPETDPSDERFILLAGKATWKLDAQLFEELQGIDIGEFFQSTARDRPHHAERLDAGLTRFCVDRLRLV